MKRMNRMLARTAAITMLAALSGPGSLISPAAAQQKYPVKPVRVVVPSAAGISTDILARIVSNKLNERLGWIMVVENRPGGNFIIGIQNVLQAPADGYSVLIATGGMSVLPVSTKNLPFDLLKDLIPVTRLANSPLLVFSNPSLPFRTLPEMVAYAKANPGKLSYATTGSGTYPHLAGEIMKQATGINMVHIPYRDTALIADVMSGTVQVGVSTAASISAQLKSGKLRPLGTLGLKRGINVGDVPAIGETGLPPQNTDVWFGIMVRAGTAPEIVTTLNREIVSILELPDVREQYLNIGAIPSPESPAEFRSKIEYDISTFGKVVQEMKIKFD